MTANSVYEAQKQADASGSEAPATAPAKTWNTPSSSSYYGGKLAKGAMVRFHQDVHGVGVITDWDSKTKTYAVRWANDTVVCKGYRDANLVPLTADESAEIYMLRYEVTNSVEDSRDFFKKEIEALEVHILHFQNRLQAAKAVKEAYRKEPKVAPVATV